MKPSAVFEPTGESFGTKYNDDAACQHCGAGAPQTTPLTLDLKRIPKHCDIASTIAEVERVVSGRIVTYLQQYKFSGLEFNVVRHARQSSTSSRRKNNELALMSAGGTRRDPSWYQMNIVSERIRMSAMTKFGKDPFDLDIDGTYCCPLGHIPGLNILSEVFVDRQQWSGSDIRMTEQYTGVRRGLIRPSQLVLVSSKMRLALIEAQTKGIEFEVARLV